MHEIRIHDTIAGFSSAAAAHVSTADVFWRDNDQVTDVTEQDPSFDLFSSDDEGMFTLCVSLPVDRSD